MDTQLIKIDVSGANKGCRSQSQNQYGEWVARFCYAAAMLPPSTVDHMLDLMETCGSSDSPVSTQKEGNA